jgi:hypothetical protein
MERKYKMTSDDFEESIDTFKVKFEDGNSVDAELFTRKLVKASEQATNPAAFLRLEIKATKEGSFKAITDYVELLIFCLKKYLRKNT